MTRPVILICALAVLWCWQPAPVSAQATDFHLQDSVYVDLIVGSDTLSPSDVWAAYLFYSMYDSAYVAYYFTECKKNSARINLAHWHVDSTRLSWNAAQLADSSRTIDFYVGPSDTISFYRELLWDRILGTKVDSLDFYSLDSLDYSVELLRKSNGQRISLLDSMGVKRRISGGAPSYHGSGPIMKRVSYIHPSNLTGDTAYIRIRIYSRGTGSYNTVRRDLYTVQYSDRLTSSRWSTYRNRYNGAFPKRGVKGLETLQNNSSSQARLEVSPVTKDGEVTITFDPPSQGGETWVVVYDASGDAVFVPFADLRLVAGATAKYVFPKSGTYFVALVHGKSIVKSIAVNYLR